MARIQQLFGLWGEVCDDPDSYKPPLWATRKSMFASLFHKDPGLAGWDRLLRMQVRLEEKNGLEEETPLHDLFEEYTKVDGRMTSDELQVVSSS